MTAPGFRRSTYLTALEAALADELAKQNCMSFNMVIRIGLRALAGLPTPPLMVPDELAAELLGEQVSEGVSAA